MFTPSPGLAAGRVTLRSIDFAGCHAHAAHDGSAIPWFAQDITSPVRD
jgi:hypothetical protein